jgi:hypothetical protein
MRRKKFQRDRPLEPDILGPVNDAHAAAPDFLDDPVLSGDKVRRCT